MQTVASPLVSEGRGVQLAHLGREGAERFAVVYELQQDSEVEKR